MIFVYGLYLKNFWVMYLGRIILGWGIEDLVPTVASFISKYFKDDYLVTFFPLNFQAFTISLNEFFATFGSIFCMYFCPLLSEKYGIVIATFSGVILNIISFLFSVVCFFFDRHADKTAVSYQSVPAVLGPLPEKEEDHFGEVLEGEDEVVEERNFLVSAYDIE
jgi:MFS family permease